MGCETHAIGLREINTFVRGVQFAMEMGLVCNAMDLWILDIDGLFDESCQLLGISTALRIVLSVQMAVRGAGLLPTQ